MNEQILLYYLYTPLDKLKDIMRWQKELCSSLNLTGRIIIAHEGINGTLGGSLEETNLYITAMHNDARFKDIVFKKSAGCKEDFPRLQIKIKPEIVRLGIDSRELTAENGGEHLSPEQFHELLSNRPDNLVLIDCRNNYESAIGTFRGAVKPPTDNFRDFPAYVDSVMDSLEDKQVAMYCTGGVRCERASTYLKEKGIKTVYQLDGGIAKYVEKYPDGHFRGKLYVFDDRVALKINDDILSTCSQCSKPCDDYTDCGNPHCNKQYIVCAACITTGDRTCSSACTAYLAEHKAVPRKVWRSGPHKQAV